jgi:amino acid permease
MVAQYPSLPVYFADALSLTKRKSKLPPLKQRTKQQSIGLAASSSNENDRPSKGTNQPSSSVGSATIPEEVFNLVKSIIGAGVLSLPAGIALMASNGASSSTTNSRILLSTSSMLIALMGGISAYTFSLIARVCKMTNSNTYADCWKATKGQSLAWIVALSSTLDCFAGNLTYSMVLADTFRQLFSYLFELGGSGGGKYAAVFATLNAYNSRTRVLLVLTATILMPLCFVKNLSSLAPFSLVGILGMVYTAFVIGLRYFDGS